MSSDSVVISDLINKYGEFGFRRIINNASNYIYDQDRKKEEKDKKEILENPHVLAYIEHFKSWVVAEVKKKGYQIEKSRDTFDFETDYYESSWLKNAMAKFDFGVSLLPIDWQNRKVQMEFNREFRHFISDLPYKFYEKHHQLDYVELSRDNQYGHYITLSCDVSDYNPFIWPWGE